MLKNVENVSIVFKMTSSNEQIAVLSLLSCLAQSDSMFFSYCKYKRDIDIRIENCWSFVISEKSAI